MPAARHENNLEIPPCESFSSSKNVPWRSFFAPPPRVFSIRPNRAPSFLERLFYSTASHGAGFLCPWFFSTAEARAGYSPSPRRLALQSRSTWSLAAHVSAPVGDGAVSSGAAATAAAARCSFERLAESDATSDETFAVASTAFIVRLSRRFALYRRIRARTLSFRPSSPAAVFHRDAAPAAAAARGDEYDDDAPAAAAAATSASVQSHGWVTSAAALGRRFGASVRHCAMKSRAPGERPRQYLRAGRRRRGARRRRARVTVESGGGGSRRFDDDAFEASASRRSISHGRGG